MSRSHLRDTHVNAEERTRHRCTTISQLTNNSPDLGVSVGRLKKKKKDFPLGPFRPEKSVDG